MHSVDDLTVTQLLLLLRERIDVLQGELKLSGRELELAGVLSHGASPYLESMRNHGVSSRGAHWFVSGVGNQTGIPSLVLVHLGISGLRRLPGG